MYVCMYVRVCIYTYIYIYRERERQRQREILNIFNPIDGMDRIDIILYI